MECGLRTNQRVLKNPQSAISFQVGTPKGNKTTADKDFLKMSDYQPVQKSCRETGCIAKIGVVFSSSLRWNRVGEGRVFGEQVVSPA